MVIGDGDGRIETAHQVTIGFRYQPTFMIIIVGYVEIGFVVNKQHTETVTDSDAWRHDEKMVSKAGIVVILALVNVVIEYQHGHHHGFACACSHFEGSPWQHKSAIFRDAILSSI